MLFARTTDQGPQWVRSVKKCRSGSRSDPCMSSSSSFCNFKVLETDMTRHGTRYSLEQIELVCKDKDAACSAPVLNRLWSCWVAELKWIVRKDTCVSMCHVRHGGLSSTRPPAQGCLHVGHKGPRAVIISLCIVTQSPRPWYVWRIVQNMGHWVIAFKYCQGIGAWSNRFCQQCFPLKLTKSKKCKP